MTKIYNSLVNGLEILDLGKEVKVYLCGPTVYSYIHIGNARPLVFFDVVRRYLSLNHKVTYIQNFTDIDDKIINRAKDENKSMKEITEKYIEEYFLDADALNVKRADFHPKATDFVSDMIDSISSMLDRGDAYIKSDGIYFDISKSKGYGILSNREPSKDGKDDFAIWKFESNEEISWEASFGRGRPGWHTECVVMINRLVGEVDIHCGGQDLIFPHHENEIAQHNSSFSKPLAKYWMHNSFIQMAEEKMSKSKGNIFLVRDLLNRYRGEVIRFFILSTHYRKPISFSEEALNLSEAAFSRIEKFMVVNFLSNGSYDFKSEIESLNDFYKHMDNDFNVQGFFGLIFEIIKRVNKMDSFNEDNLKVLKNKMRSLFEVLGFTFKDTSDLEIDLLVKKRRKARNIGDFESSDKLRDKLRERGVEVLDGKKTVWFRVS